MSQSGPPADAKQAQAAALQELEAAQKRKRAIDTSLVSAFRTPDNLSRLSQLSQLSLLSFCATASLCVKDIIWNIYQDVCGFEQGLMC